METPSRKHRKDRLSEQGILSTPCRSTPKLVSPSSSKTQQPSFTGERKIFYLIRHGQSLGQTTKSPTARRMDESLLDCGLSKMGISQAQSVQLPDTVELIVSSPLLRAVATACLANHCNLPILIHYHLREIGSLIPENIPRPRKAVLRDLQRTYGITHTDTIDWETLAPDEWPRRHDESPKLIRRDRISDALFWLAKHREEREMAVFCHYHVIAAAVGVKAANACVIPCEMCTESGAIRLLSGE